MFYIHLETLCANFASNFVTSSIVQMLQYDAIFGLNIKYQRFARVRNIAKPANVTAAPEYTSSELIISDKWTLGMMRYSSI